MKQFLCFCLALCCMLASSAQLSSLSLATHKTTTLVFPFPIKHVDRGSPDVLVQPLKEAQHILLVKAASAQFAETNLSVVTGDGSVYSFLVCPGEPSAWVHHLEVRSQKPPQQLADILLHYPPALKGIQAKKNDLTVKVSGIYISNEVLYYQIHFSNESPLSFQPEFIRFYIRDKQKAKRKAIQESEIQPLAFSGTLNKLPAHSTAKMVWALPQFGLADDKIMVMEIGEQNGGRNILLKIRNKNILNALNLTL